MLCLVETTKAFFVFDSLPYQRHAFVSETPLPHPIPFPINPVPYHIRVIHRERLKFEIFLCSRNSWLGTYIYSFLLFLVNSDVSYEMPRELDTYVNIIKWVKRLPCVWVDELFSNFIFSPRSTLWFSYKLLGIRAQILLEVYHLNFRFLIYFIKRWY